VFAVLKGIEHYSRGGRYRARDFNDEIHGITGRKHGRIFRLNRVSTLNGICSLASGICVFPFRNSSLAKGTVGMLRRAVGNSHKANARWRSGELKGDGATGGSSSYHSHSDWTVGGFPLLESDV
jgi:hypothetical protein